MATGFQPRRPTWFVNKLLESFWWNKITKKMHFTGETDVSMEIEPNEIPIGNENGDWVQHSDILINPHTKYDGIEYAIGPQNDWTAEDWIPSCIVLTGDPNYEHTESGFTTPIYKFRITDEALVDFSQSGTLLMHDGAMIIAEGVLDDSYERNYFKPEIQGKNSKSPTLVFHDGAAVFIEDDASVKLSDRATISMSDYATIQMQSGNDGSGPALLMDNGSIFRMQNNTTYTSENSPLMEISTDQILIDTVASQGWDWNTTNYVDPINPNNFFYSNYIEHPQLCIEGPSGIHMQGKNYTMVSATSGSKVFTQIDANTSSGDGDQFHRERNSNVELKEATFVMGKYPLATDASDNDWHYGSLDDKDMPTTGKNNGPYLGISGTGELSLQDGNFLVSWTDEDLDDKFTVINIEENAQLSLSDAAEIEMEDTSSISMSGWANLTIGNNASISLNQNTLTIAYSLNSTDKVSFTLDELKALKALIENS